MIKPLMCLTLLHTILAVPEPWQKKQEGLATTLSAQAYNENELPDLPKSDIPSPDTPRPETPSPDSDTEHSENNGYNAVTTEVKENDEKNQVPALTGVDGYGTPGEVNGDNGYPTTVENDNEYQTASTISDVPEYTTVPEVKGDDGYQSDKQGSNGEPGDSPTVGENLNSDHEADHTEAINNLQQSDNDDDDTYKASVGDNHEYKELTNGKVTDNMGLDSSPYTTECNRKQAVPWINRVMEPYKDGGFLEFFGNKMVTNSNGLDIDGLIGKFMGVPINQHGTNNHYRNNGISRDAQGLSRSNYRSSHGFNHRGNLPWK